MPDTLRDSEAGRLADMLEATRLTGLGRLDEATALIQRSLGLRAAPPRPEPPTLDLTALPGPGAAPRPEAASLRVRDVVGSVVRGLAPVLKGLGGAPRAPLEVPRGAPPAGRGLDGGEVGFVSRAYDGPEGARAYKLFIPSKPQAPAPLVVMLHGCTQDPDDFAAGTGMNALAERTGLFVAYPAQSRRAHAQRCWNWYDPRDQGRGGEPAIIAGLTRAVMEAHPVDPGRVYVAGLSAGGAAALNLARAYPDLYAAAGVHSGLAAGCARDVGSALRAMQAGAAGAAGPGVPTIVFHGDEDATVSARNAEQILAQAGAAGLRAEVETVAPGGRGHGYTRTRYADRAGRVVLEDWRVRGQGHAWSGGRSAGSYTDPDGPDASAAMLDFFAGHRLPRAR